MKSSGRPRGRPRSFDEDKALDGLAQIFWSRGFAASSLDDLAKAAGVTRPSLYMAFGDKRQMYQRVLARYAAELEATMATCLSDDVPARQGLSDYYRLSIEHFLSGDDGPRGCLAVCTASAEAAESPEIRHDLAGVLAGMDKGFERYFAAAARRGELPPGADPAALAGVAAGFSHTLAIRARAGAGRDELRALADQATKLLFPASA